MIVTITRPNGEILHVSTVETETPEYAIAVAVDTHYSDSNKIYLSGGPVEFTGLIVKPLGEVAQVIASVVITVTK